MKKSRIKNYLKLVILIFSISLLTTNCEKSEDFLKEEPISKPRFSIELIPHETFSKNSKLFEKVQKLDKTNNLNKSSRSVYNENFGFTVDLEDSKYLESNNGNYHSYTFTITRDEPIDLLENLVVSLQQDGSYKTLITAYHLLDFSNFGVAYQEIDFNTDTVFSKTSQSRSCITWTTCEIWDYYCTDCESENPEWTYSCGAYSTHQACDYTIDVGDSSTGGGPSPSSTAPYVNNGSQWDNTFWSTGSGGGTSNTGNDSNTDNPPDNNEPCIQDANGNCIGDATSPKIKTPEIPTEPCDELNKLSLDFGTKSALADLTNNTNQVSEKGYALKKNSTDGSFRTPEQTLDSQASANGLASQILMTNYLGNEYIGFFHTHPRASDGWFPMFGIGDLNTLHYLASRHNNNGQPKNHSEYVVTLTVPQGTYAIKIKNWFAFRYARGTKWKGKKGIKKTLEDKFKYRDSEGDINLMIKDVLDIFKEFNMGVGLYKASEDLNDWSELVHDLNPLSPTFGYPIEKPCEEL